MTIVHMKEQPVSMKGPYSESHHCVDCRMNTAPGCPPRELAEFLMNRDGKVPMRYDENSEVYIVKDALWKAAGMEPYGGCLCVGCLEKRIGRKADHVFNDSNMPCTDRLRQRRGG